MAFAARSFNLESSNHIMTIAQQQILLAPSATHIYRFEEVYSFRAAQEQAEKEKLSAFGMLAKLTPWNRPKAETVMLARSEARLEPFWHVQATRTVDYTSTIQYPVSVHNPFAQKVTILGHEFELARHGDKAKFELTAEEHCHRKLPYSAFIDGLQRSIKESVFENYCSKYRFQEISEVESQSMVKPLIPQQAVIQQACAQLNAQAINAHAIQQDTVTLEDVSLYLRPVFAFEFIWSSADKSGVIEVDGLTGAVRTDGQWFADKLDRILTREMLVDASAELAGVLVPGGGLAVKVINQLTR